MATRKLPPYLHYDKRVRQFRYRRPDTGTYHWMGANRDEAIDAANQLNQQLIPSINLVESVLGKMQSLSEYLDTRFIPVILPQRRLAMSTHKQYLQKITMIKKDIGWIDLKAFNTRVVANFLNQFSICSANRFRVLLRLIFRYAIAEGWMEKNPAADTIPHREEKQRRRLNYEGFLSIYNEAEPWLQNAMDLGLLTLQRRSDVLNMKFEDIKEGFLYVIQQKTKKHSESAYIKIKLNSMLEEVIERCKKDGVSRYLVHRVAERRIHSDRRDDQSKVFPDFLTQAFSEIRDQLPLFQNMPSRERPTFHEIRALGIKLYENQGFNAQKLAGHTTRRMTEVYMQGHEVQWTAVEAELSIKHIQERSLTKEGTEIFKFYLLLNLLLFMSEGYLLHMMLILLGWIKLSVIYRK